MTKRRDFIRKSALGTAGIAIGGIGFSAKSYASIIGANERINIAVIEAIKFIHDGGIGEVYG